MEVDALLSNMDVLYKTALIKTRDAGQAEELVQETCLYALDALSRGTQIHNPKAYLLSVLNNRLFMALRKKYKISTVYYDEMPNELACDKNLSDEVIRSEEAQVVRRELAFLAKTYREAMVLYYVKGQSVAQIAETLSHTQGHRSQPAGHWKRKSEKRSGKNGNLSSE